MNTAFFDCQSGIAGDMIVGALINAGLPPSYLKKELSKLRISHYALRLAAIKSHHIKATKISVVFKKEKIRRNLKDILNIINKSKLKRRIKQLSSKIFKRLAEAEAKVHGMPVNQVHFHEVGAVDAIVDIVGASIGFDYFDIEDAFCSPINTGILAPATIELLKGIPIYDSGIKKELATPTGAAIMSTLVKSPGPFPRIKVLNGGFGAGSYNLKTQPNFLRLIIGEKELQTEKDAVLLIEANIDDMNPKLYDKTIAALIKNGALDAWVEPIRMKKQRNAVKFCALSRIELKDKIVQAIFEHTTSLGLRIFLVQREKARRFFKTIKTKYGKIKLKIGKLGGNTTNVAPEYENLKKISKKYKVPISKVLYSVPATKRRG